MSTNPAHDTTSFPVTIWYDPESEEIVLARLTDRAFVVRVSRISGSETCHGALYAALAQALRDANVPAPPIRDGTVERPH